MYLGYLAQRTQLMVHVTFNHSLIPETISNDREEKVSQWLISWWGDELPTLDGDEEARVIHVVGVLHNLICQDARLPLFDLPVVDVGGEKPGCWVPSLMGLDHRVHSMALQFALSAIAQPTESACHAVLAGAVQKVHKKAGNSILGLSDGSIPILAEAHDRGLHFYHQADDIVQVGQGANSRLIHVSASDADSAAGMLLSENKAMMAAVFKKAGIPTPDTMPTQSPDIAPVALKRLQGPLIVKPERGARGQGVVTGITSEALLRRAISSAIQSSPAKIALIQRQMKGDCHRVLVLNGEVMWASTRYPKSVVADGSSTVAQLIDTANDALRDMPARKRLRPFPADDLAVATVKKQGFTMNAVPPEGQRVLLRPVTSVADGGDAKKITETLHPANAAICIEAAKICRLNTAGIDFFSEDPTVPWFENGGCILEVNYKPQVFNRLSDRITSDPHKRFVTQLISGAGHIPIHAFVGASLAKERATQRHRELVAEGVNAWLYLDEGISGPEGFVRPTKDENRLKDLHSLMHNPRVEALCLQVGVWGAERILPITHVTTVETCNDEDDPAPDSWAQVADRLQFSSAPQA